MSTTLTLNPALTERDTTMTGWDYVRRSLKILFALTILVIVVRHEMHTEFQYFAGEAGGVVRVDTWSGAWCVARPEGGCAP